MGDMRDSNGRNGMGGRYMRHSRKGLSSMSMSTMSMLTMSMSTMSMSSMCTMFMSMSTSMSGRGCVAKGGKKKIAMKNGRGCVA